ncbi:MAG: DUF4200 domain-containing protein, partial [Anaerolineaceae bacterium]|nr:DUF4200 domain-containing protein [Anaerolineaceae bacterium]
MNNTSDLMLIRRFEPVVRYTRGERFFPIQVMEYIPECSLWVQHPNAPPELIIPEGELSLEKIANCRPTGFGSVYYLQFIEPLNLAELATFHVKERLKRKDPKEIFHPGRGRLSRVGYLSRIMDALFSITLLARGRVPGDTAAAAALTYQDMRSKNGSSCYHAHVIRKSGWIILQYWYFYVFNDWRSSFFGANDHEADWEMVNVYLFETHDGEVHPEWVAYANHDFSGDDRRRRWDDPELQKVSEHPVVYAAAGSHASYFSPGDYLTEVELPYLSPLVRLLDRVRNYWQRLLRQTIGNDETEEDKSGFNIFRIPFVDYARGDGLAIGMGEDLSWGEPVLLNPAPPWVMNYRGLWGYFARDPVSGENAPAGARYRRDGSVRSAWYDPVGWAGLDKVPPPTELRSYVIERQSEIESERHNLNVSLYEKQHLLHDRSVEAKAMRGHPHMKTAYRKHQEVIKELTNDIRDIKARISEDETMLETLRLYEKDLKEGRKEPSRAHIQRARSPEKESDLRLGWIAEFWSAV